MAWTKVQSVSVPSSGAPTSTTVAVTVSAVGSGNAICGQVAWDAPPAQTLVSVTDDQGNIYNLEATVQNVNDGEDYAAFSRTNITNAPTVITATFSGAIGYRGIFVDEFSGGSTASSDERDGSAHGGQYQLGAGNTTDAITSGAFTTTVNGDLIWGSVGAQLGTSPLAAGTGFASGVDSVSDYRVMTEYRTQATAGSGTAATFTQNPTSGSTSTFMIALKPPGAAPYVPYNPWPQAAPVMAQ